MRPKIQVKDFQNQQIKEDYVRTEFTIYNCPQMMENNHIITDCKIIYLPGVEIIKGGKDGRW